VKFLLSIQDVYLQVLLTRLTSIDKTRLFLYLTNFDKNRLVAFHSFKTNNVIFMCEKCTGVWMTLIHFCHYQLTVVANSLLLTGDKSVTTFSMLCPKPFITGEGKLTSLLSASFCYFPPVTVRGGTC
jgi:hypothetical protein